MKRDKTERRTYTPPPLAESGRKRQVVNLPSNRIVKMLECVDGWEAWSFEVIDYLTRVNPALVEGLPHTPDMSYVEAERMYQRVRGKYNEANRLRTRLSRSRAAQGMIPLRPTPELMRAVEDELGLSGRIDDRSIPTVSADDTPQRTAEEIMHEELAVTEPTPEPKVTIIEHIIEPLPGLKELNIKEPDDENTL